MTQDEAKSGITMRDIAAAVGVSVATVSLALRDSPKITREIREKVKKTAAELGYRPSPLVSAYQSYLRQHKALKFQGIIGWINDHPDKDFWIHPWNAPLREGAQHRAQSLGYTLDSIWIDSICTDDPEKNIASFQRILDARGILAIILPNLHRPHHAAFLWENKVVVCIGRHHLLLERSSLQVQSHIEYHSVMTDDYNNTRLAIQQLRACGCRRVGLVLSVWEDRGTDGLCTAAYLREALDWPKSNFVPILFSDSEKEVIDWLRKHRPDGVVCAHSAIKHHIESAGLNIPRDVRLAHLNIAQDVAGWSGISRNLFDIGQTAVELLVSSLYANEFNVPSYSKKIMLQGTWVKGSTT